MPEQPTNPFVVQTPESTSAEDVVSLFVDVFSDFQHIPHPGHTFVHGPRGSGKTMMFRFLEPDCQRLQGKRALSELEFFGAYVPIKNTDLALTELMRLEGSYADGVLSEHFMTIHVVAKFLRSLRKDGVAQELDTDAPRLATIYSDVFRPLVERAGGDKVLPAPKGSTASDLLLAMQEAIDAMYVQVIQYLRRLSFSPTPVEYNASLTGFLDFLVPLLNAFRELRAFPSGPIFLLLDDADNLNLTQTKILNSWVATRMSSAISLKISTQLAYATFLTSSGQRISSPHDFHEINISDVYTSKSSAYQARMREIIKKRLAQHNREPGAFFPQDDDQEAAITKIAETHRKKSPEDRRGFHARDDVNRYSRPDYMRDLAKHRGGRSNYSYAGFEQLVHISSGVVRHFLDAASMMYAEEAAKPSGVVNAISPAIQDKVVRMLADDFFYSHFDKIVQDTAGNDDERDRFGKLRNLIHALGNAFHQILISHAAERRVFSVALSDGGRPEVVAVFRLGVRFGYFHESTIGAKVGIGRVPLFILTRRLAPFFDLDPTSFAGYQFATSEALLGAMKNPTAFVRKIQGKRGMAAVFEDPQMLLPLEEAK